MARVYLAYDQTLGAERAIKIIRGTGRSVMRREQRLLREARAMSDVDHPNVLRFFEFGNSSEGAYIIMRVAGGGSLEELVRESGPQSPKQAVSWMLDILDGLVIVHQTGVVHRDIKPSNILLDKDGTPLLADFGIARLDVEDTMTRMNAAMGSLSYMPPEQRLDAHGVDKTADLYSVACTLYNVLTATTPLDLFATDPESRRWRAIPPVLRPILQKATQLEPAARYRDAESFRDALREALPGLDTLAEAAPIPSAPSDEVTGTVDASVSLDTQTMPDSPSARDTRVATRSEPGRYLLGIALIGLATWCGVSRLRQAMEFSSPTPLAVAGLVEPELGRDGLAAVPGGSASSRAQPEPVESVVKTVTGADPAILGVLAPASETPARTVAAPTSAQLEVPVPAVQDVPPPAADLDGAPASPGTSTGDDEPSELESNASRGSPSLEGPEAWVQACQQQTNREQDIAGCWVTDSWLGSRAWVLIEPAGGAWESFVWNTRPGGYMVTAGTVTREGDGYLLLDGDPDLDGVAGHLTWSGAQLLAVIDARAGDGIGRRIRTSLARP